MPVRRVLQAFAAASLLSTAALCQARLPVAPLPNDPLELATGPVKVLDTPQVRALVLGLLEQARQNSGMHTAGGAPYDVKVSFQSLGSSRYTGAGGLEETWLSGKTWRWTAHIGDYTINHMFYKGATFDEKPKGPIPLRLQMVRSALFWPVSGNFAPSYLRVATAKWTGEEVMCILRSRGADVEDSDAAEDAHSTSNPGRRWDEKEYCIDPKTRLLRTYSEAPGIYTVYDYNSDYKDFTVHFHGRILAQQISVVEGGNTILQIHLDSIEDPRVTDPNFFTPTPHMLERGPQGIMGGPFHFTQFAPAPPGHAQEIQPVIVIATLDKKGKVLEAEALQDSDPSLSGAAVSLVTHATYPAAQYGAMQRLAYINVKFVPGN